MKHDDQKLRKLISESHPECVVDNGSDEEWEKRAKAHSLAGELVHLRHAKFDLVCLVSYLIQNLPPEKLQEIIPHK